MEPLPINTTEIIAELQRRAWIPQRALAERAGIAQQTLSHYARGDRSPKLEVLEKIAAAAGYQLRLSLEPMASDVMRDVKLVGKQSTKAWLAELGSIWDGARTLVSGVAHRFEGLVAARLHGIPVTSCSVVDLAVSDDDASLGAIVTNATRCLALLRVPESGWASMPDDVETVRRRVEDGVLYWLPYRVPEVRMRLTDDIGASTTVALGEENSVAVPVAPMSELVVDDARVARVLRVVRGDA